MRLTAMDACVRSHILHAMKTGAPNSRHAPAKASPGMKKNLSRGSDG